MRRKCADHPQGGDAFRRQDRRSDLDHRLHHAQPRLHGLRHALRHGREGRDQAADGRQVRRFCRQAHLYLHAARRPCLARRRAGHSGGLRRLDQALGREGFARPEGDELRRHDDGRRREDLHGQAEGADRPAHLRARQALLERAVHDAEARRRNRSEHADLRFHRLRPVRVQARRMEARRQGRLREVRQVQAALRAGLRARGRQGGQGRPRRVARDLRSAAGDQRAARGRDRLHRVALARPPPAGEGGQERQAGRMEPARQPVHLPPEPPASAVQQSEDPSGALVRLQSEGLPRGGDRRPDLLQDLQGDVRLRLRDGDRRRHGAACWNPTSRRRAIS